MNTESKLIAKAIESVIKARNYGYKDANVDISLQMTKNETEDYINIGITGYQAVEVALYLKNVFGSLYSVQVNNNERVNISIFKG